VDDIEKNGTAAHAPGGTARSRALPRPAYVLAVPWSLNHPGGVTEVVLNLYRQLALSGEMQPLVLVSDWRAFRPVELSIEGRQTVFLRLSSPWSEWGSVLGLMKWTVAAPLYLAGLLRLLRRHRVLAFNFHYPNLGVFPIALLRFLRLYHGALILSFHGLDLQSARSGGRTQRALWRFVLRNATAIVACSQAFSLEIAEFAGKAAGRVHAIQNGLDVDDFLGSVDRSTAILAPLDGREFILSVATWEHKKGLDVLVRAFAAIRGRHPNLSLALVGRSAEAALSLRALAAELRVADQVFFFENVPHRQVGQFLERARIFCLASRAEPFGISILEAGAFRLPVVASRVGGIPEIVSDGETGLLVAPDDVSALARALEKVLAEPQLARTLGEALHLRVATHFSWRRAYQGYRALVSK
jgi:glycosyltransferase involved in cell wall biosynthesis